jgi:hypothetical protein
MHIAANIPIDQIIGCNTFKTLFIANLLFYELLVLTSDFRQKTSDFQKGAPAAQDKPPALAKPR